MLREFELNFTGQHIPFHPSPPLPTNIYLVALKPLKDNDSSLLTYTESADTWN
jgi:hypothetical protein